jgi:hypothetical protein
MKKQYLLLIAIALFLMDGCSSKKYYVPEKKVLVNKTISLEKELPSKIIFFTRDDATLENGLVIPENKKLPKGFVSLNKDLAKKGYILLVNDKQIKFKKLIVQAVKKDNLVAILFADNSMTLFSLDKNKAVLTENFGQLLGLRKFVVSPLFYKDLLVVPTLNGKLAIFNLKTKKLVREIVVSKKDYFSNVIFLAVRNNTLIAASRDNIISIAPGVFVQKEYNIKHIIADDNNIYVFTIEGDIKKLNLELKEIKSIYLKFANIIAPTFVGNNIYFVEYGDGTYLIKIDKNLENLKVYELDSPSIDDSNVFTKNGILYIKDEYIDLKSIK